MLNVHQQAIKFWGNISGHWAKHFYACQIHTGYNLVKYYLYDYTAFGDWGDFFFFQLKTIIKKLVKFGKDFFFF